jgi:hypothetical protein
VDDRVFREILVGSCDRPGARDGAAVVLGCASLRDKDVVEAGGGVVVEVWAFGGAYSCAVIAVYGANVS